MTTTRGSAKKGVTRRSKQSNDLALPTPQLPKTCASCDSLPAGSTEIMALMLVLVFSLTAVLFTSIYALNVQRAKVTALQHAVTQLSFEE